MKDNFYGKAHIQVIKHDLDQDVDFMVMMLRDTLHRYCIDNGIPREFTEEEWKVLNGLHDTDGSGDSRLIDMSEKYEEVKDE